MFDVGVENSFDFLSQEYATLFEASCATAFQHPVWLDRLYRRLVTHVRAEPLIITARRKGELVMVLPLLRRRHGAVRVIEFADLQVSDYASPICSAATFDLMLNAPMTGDKVRQILGSYDLLWIRKLCENSVPLERLFGGILRSSMEMSTHAIKLYSPFSGWRTDRMDASFRKELDKKARQLHRQGEVRFECFQNPEAVKATFLKMREYRRRRFEGRENGDLLQRPAYFDFYLDLAIQGSAAGFSRTYALCMDGRPIASAFGMSHRGEFLVLLGGFDFEGYRKQSIGALMFENVARDCIERGDTLLDFTIGDEPYKRLFGAKPSSMWMISSAGNPFGSVVNLMVHQMPWVRKMAKGVLGRAP